MGGGIIANSSKNMILQDMAVGRPGVSAKMMPQSVGSLSTPGKPNSENFRCRYCSTYISIFGRHFTSLQQCICPGCADQTLPPMLLTVRPVYNLGIVDSSNHGPGSMKLGHGPRSQNSKSTGTSCLPIRQPSAASPPPVAARLLGPIGPMPTMILGPGAV